MAKQAKEALGMGELDVVADRGYFSSEQILECSQADVTATLPKPMTTGKQTKGQFGKPALRDVGGYERASIRLPRTPSPGTQTQYAGRQTCRLPKVGP